MKNGVRIFVAAIIILVTAIGKHVEGQVLKDSDPISFIGVYHVELSDNKTTNILFPYAVKSVDRGSEDIIAQVVQGFGNVLQLKVNGADFKQTNITVITSDGRFYSFLADYNSNPELLNLSFVGKGGEGAGPVENIAISDEHYNEALLNEDAAKLLSARVFLHKHIVDGQMNLRLAGIYLKDGLMWFKLRLSNQSQVDYEPDNISFSIVDRRQAKRTARQEILLHPVFIESMKIIQGNTTKDLLLAFKPFTLANAMRLKIQINENSGGRNLTLLIKANKLLRARMLKE